MRYFTLLLISVIVFSSCVFSGKPKQAEHEVRAEMTKANMNSQIQYGDSIMVDTVIDNFRIYYKVSELIDTSLVAFSCNEDASNNEVLKVNRSILLNIQTLDTTSVVHMLVIDIDSLKKELPDIAHEDYLIDSFYLTEVMENYVVFETKLCKFGMDICNIVNIRIAKDGKMDYSLQR